MSDIKQKKTQEKDARFDTKGDARFKKIKDDQKKKNDDDERFQQRFTDKSFKEGSTVDITGRRKNVDDESSEESDDSESEDEVIDDMVWELNDHDAVRNEESSKRLAFMGLDWDGLTAEDILAVCLSSVKSPESILKVVIYPSDFGVEKMEEEALQVTVRGPNLGIAADVGTQEDKEIDPLEAAEAIRKYNQDRSKYYYGIAFCDTVKTAELLYEELDGIAIQCLCRGQPIDVRFIPDDIEFPHPHASEATKLSRGYTASNEASHTRGGGEHTTAQCNWDEGNPKRKKDLMKKFSKKEMEENDLATYLASDSDSDKGAVAQKRSTLLGDCAEVSGEDEASDFFDNSDKEEEDDDMKEMTVTIQADQDKVIEDIEKKVKAKESGEDINKSSWEQYLQRKKEKRKERKNKLKKKNTDGDDEEKEEEKEEETEAQKNELELLMAENATDRDFDLKKKKKKKRKRVTENEEEGIIEDDDKQQITFKENVGDERLKQVFDDPDFAIDPTNPAYKKTDIMDKFLTNARERKKKKKNTPVDNASKEKPKTTTDSNAQGFSFF